jgi:hypothetical protein
MSKPFALLAAAASLALLVAGCQPSRFASCQTDNDCNDSKADAGKLVCYNLRCVECHYDGDCADGKICGTNNTCESLDTRTPEGEAPPPPKTLEECAKRCKGNPACGDSCREQFKNAPK